MIRWALLGVSVILAACGKDTVGIQDCSGPKPASAEHVVATGVYTYHTAWPGGSLVGDMVLTKATPDSVGGYTDIVASGKPTRRFQFQRRDVNLDVLCLEGRWVDQSVYIVGIGINPPGQDVSGTIMHHVSRGPGGATDLRCTAEFRPTQSVASSGNPVPATTCTLTWRKSL